MRAVEAPEPAVQHPQVWPISVKAYHTLGELGLIPKRTELLYGQVFKKMSKSPLHSLLVLRLLRLLQTVVPSGWHVRPEQPITCGDSEPEPDLAVVRGREEDFGREHPQTADLVIEVCVTSHDFDRSKLRAYATAGVKEVWLVLGPQKQIEVWREPAAAQYGGHEIHGPGGKLSSVLPKIVIDMDRLFAK